MGLQGDSRGQVGQRGTGELDKFAARQIDEPWVAFGGEDGPAQVRSHRQTEKTSASIRSRPRPWAEKTLIAWLDILVPAHHHSG